MTFHHGGRIGDLIYALYTVKELGGGDIIVSDFQQGNWGETQARSLLPLLNYQEYVRYACYHPHDLIAGHDKITHDLHNAELDHNPGQFPEWHGKSWPGNCNIAKRYAVHFGVTWKPGTTWLEAPKDHLPPYVSFHAPMRRCTDTKAIAQVVNALCEQTAVVMFGGTDWREWEDLCPQADLVQSKDMLEVARIINSSRVFLGSVSSGHAIAEGLGKPRFVQQAEGCDNVIPTAVINDWSPERIVEQLTTHL